MFGKFTNWLREEFSIIVRGMVALETEINGIRVEQNKFLQSCNGHLEQIELEIRESHRDENIFLQQLCKDLQQNNYLQRCAASLEKMQSGLEQNVRLLAQSNDIMRTDMSLLLSSINKNTLMVEANMRIEALKLSYHSYPPAQLDTMLRDIINNALGVKPLFTKEEIDEAQRTTEHIREMKNATKENAKS